MTNILFRDAMERAIIYFNTVNNDYLLILAGYLFRTIPVPKKIRA